MPGPIRTRRIYEPADVADGARFLVDRLWPRGISKDRANLAAWLKVLAPSDDLRRQYHGAAGDSDEAWQAFRQDYFAELDGIGPEGKAELGLIDTAAAAGPVTLLYAAKNEQRNNAVALAEWLANHRRD